MSIKIVEPFGPNKSKGTFDDVFDQLKYDSIEEAWKANDYVHCDYVIEDDLLKIQMYHTKNPEEKLKHVLLIQNCPMGIDVRDDRAAITMAISIIQNLKDGEE